MKHLILLLTVYILCSGCSHVRYTAPDGTSAEYWRLGPQRLDNLIIRLPDGSEMGLDRQEADITLILKALLSAK